MDVSTQELLVDATLPPQQQARPWSARLSAAATPRWMGWRRRALVLATAVGAFCVLAWAYALTLTPYLGGQWVATHEGAVELQDSKWPALASARGHTLLSVAAPGQTATPVDRLLLHRSLRWQPSGAARAQALAQDAALTRGLAQGAVQLRFAAPAPVADLANTSAAPPGRAQLGPVQVLDLAVPARGWAGLGWAFWPLAAMALVMYVFGWVVYLARPQARNLLFLVMALCQSGNLLAIALTTLPGLGFSASLLPQALALDLPLRAALDLCTAAAIVHAFALHPRRLTAAPTIGMAVWSLAALGWWAVMATDLTHAWWWLQGLCLLLGTAALLTVTLSYRQEPNPYTLAMQRFAIAALTTLLLVTAAIALATDIPALAHGVAVGASVAWTLFLASLLLLAPFLSGRRSLLREFALLAGVSTVAASLDLLFVSVFAVGPFASLAIAVFFAFALYAGARQFALTQMLSSRQLSTERTFELLYRAARQVQARPSQYAQTLVQLLRELFEPLEVVAAARVPARAQVVAGGSALTVPLASGTALTLRFAQRGRRLFGHEDSRLADRVVEQLRRARAYDQAVEKGRTEERLRIAQDLHDDIGARLLTLMYQAPTPELEDYIRHTLQDLKTLTRGLAASEHLLSHAAAEWKSDLAQRLAAARAELVWSFSADQDLQLSVVQWSALTRVIRELVTNALFHGSATRVEVNLSLEQGHLKLQVLDDGKGQAPHTWAHGLGLGGVRKRVKLLGGEVRWTQQLPSGILCTVTVPVTRPAAAPSG